MTPFALLLGIGPLVKWRRDQFSEIRTPVVVSVIVMAIAGFALPYFLQNKLTVSAVLGTMMSVIIVLLSLYEMKQRATHRESFFKGINQTFSFPLGDDFGSPWCSDDRLGNCL